MLPLDGGPRAPPAPWRDLLTGTVHQGPGVALAALTQRLPVALLVRADQHLDAPAASGDDDAEVPR